MASSRWTLGRATGGKALGEINQGGPRAINMSLRRSFPLASRRAKGERLSVSSVINDAEECFAPAGLRKY